MSQWSMSRGIVQSVTIAALMFTVTAGQAAPAVQAPSKSTSSTTSTPTSAKLQKAKSVKNKHVSGSRPATGRKTAVTVTTGARVLPGFNRGSLTGRVTNANGGAVPMATVRLVAAGSHHRNRHVHPAFATMTNATGSFTVHMIRARHYQLVTSKRGVGRSDRLVRVTSGASTHVNVVLGSASPAKKHHRKHK